MISNIAASLILTLIFIAAGETRAAGARDLCPRALAEITPDFEPELTLNPMQSSVRYKGVTFLLGAQSFRFLRLIVEAPDQVVPIDEILAGARSPRAAKALVAMTKRVRREFRLIDPNFDKLSVLFKVGFYWKRDHLEVITRGRVAAAKFTHDGFADGARVPLNPAEHALLLELLKNETVSARMVSRQENSFRATACTINRKLRAVLGENVAIGGPRGRTEFSFNEALMTDAP